MSSELVPSTESKVPGPRRRFAPDVRFGLAVALTVTGYAALAWWVLRPLHERGLWQPAVAFLQGFDHLLQAPGLLLAQRLGLRAGHHITPAAWGFAALLNAIGYYVVARTLYGRWQWLS